MTERIYSKQIKVTSAQGTDFEVNHYADGDIMIKQEGSRNMVYIPPELYDHFMLAMKRPS